MSILSSGFSIKFKLGLLLLAIPTLVLVLYVFIMLRVISEDKRAYVFDASANLAKSNAAHFHAEMIVSAVQAKDLLTQNNGKWTFAPGIKRKIKKIPEVQTIIISKMTPRGLIEEQGVSKQKYQFFSLVKKFNSLTKDLQKADPAIVGLDEKSLWFASKLGKNRYLFWHWVGTPVSGLLNIKEDTGAVLVRSDWTPVWGSYNLSAPPAAISAPTLSFESENSISSVSQIGNLDLFVLTSIDKNIALSGIHALARKSILFFVMVTLGTAIISVLVSRRFLNRLIDLQKTSLAISKGDLGARIQAKGSDEIGSLAQSFNQMADDVKSLINQRDDMIDDLKTTQKMLVRTEKLATVGEMSASLSHEIGNPLTIMAMTFEAIETDLGTVDEKIKPHFRRLRSSLDRLKKLSNSLKTFVHGGRENELVEVIHPKKIMEEIQDFLVPLLNANSVEFKINFTGDVLPISGQSSMIQQVFINLVKNAIEAYPEQSINREINIDIKSNDNTTYFVIRDNGPGMSPEVQSKLFTPFFTTKERGKGTGLGLSVSRNIIEQHGGKLELESIEGKGTSFTISLPGQSAHSTVKNIDLTGMKILFVDDEIDLRELVSKYFSLHQVNIRTATDGVDGIRVYDEFNPDIVITDFSMPKMDGYQFAQQIRQKKPDAKIIMLTGSVGYRPHPSDTVFDVIVRKPFSRELISQAIEAVMNKDSSHPKAA